MHFELSSKKQQSLMSHECPPAVRSKLRDQRVRKHARRISPVTPKGTPLHGTASFAVFSWRSEWGLGCRREEEPNMWCPGNFPWCKKNDVKHDSTECCNCKVDGEIIMEKPKIWLFATLKRLHRSSLKFASLIISRISFMVQNFIEI